MKNYKLQTSEGVRDYIGEELLIKEEIEDRIKKLFLSYGYNLVKTPTFEYLDVYMTDGVQKPSLYNLINRQGEVLALRNDITASIARIVASKDNDDIIPKKYCYIANTFRYPRLYQGKSHEFTQAGIELIGISSIKAEIECIKLAYQALNNVNINKFTVHIGSAHFMNELFKDFNLNNDEIECLLNTISLKDFVKLKNQLIEYRLDASRIELVLKIMRNAGKLNFLQGIIDELKGLNSAKILNDLRVLYDELLKVGLENKVVFDFSISQYANYYTGITFQVFAGGIGRAVISGGRCDQLLKSFGKDLPAIGFGLDVDAILEYIISNKLIEINNLRYVSFSDTASHEFALKNNEELRNKGIIVEVSMLDSLDDTIKYAKNSGALVVLNYKNNKLEEIKVGE